MKKQGNQNNKKILYSGYIKKTFKIKKKST